MLRALWVATLALLLVGVGTSPGFAQSPGGDETAEEVAQRAASIADEARRQREAAAGEQVEEVTQPGQPPTNGDGTGLSLGVAVELEAPVNSGSSESGATTSLEFVARYMTSQNFGFEGALSPLGVWWTENVSPFHVTASVGPVLKLDWFTVGAGAKLGLFQNPNDRPPHYGAAELYLAPGLEIDNFRAGVKVAYVTFSELERLNGSPSLGINVGWMFF